MRRMVRRCTWTTAPSTATSSGCARSSARSMTSLTRSRPSTASATATATPDPDAARGRRAAAPADAEETVRPARPARATRRRRFSPLTRRILALNMLPLALLAGGVIFLGQYEDELIEGELSALRVQAEMVAAGLGE